MSREKQIEEMAKATMKNCKIDNQCGSCHWSTCNECLADVIYNAGYRKASDVAREIFEEIYEDCFDQFGYINYEALAELKKKYTGEKE